MRRSRTTESVTTNPTQSKFVVFTSDKRATVFDETPDVTGQIFMYRWMVSLRNPAEKWPSAVAKNEDGHEMLIVFNPEQITAVAVNA